MSENCSDCGSDGVSGLLATEKGRNKRKFLCELSMDVTAEASNVSLTQVPQYELLEEKFQNALNELGSMMEKPVEEQNVEESQEGSDWDDPVTCQLEELLTNNLNATFCSAVKKIVESGYSVDVAEMAVLNSSLFHGSKDPVSNVVDSALSILKREKELSTTKQHPIFEGMQGLVDYTLLEMIYVLREVRPSLTVSEAMWCLLLSDLNLVNVCVAMEGGVLVESKSETSETSQAKEDSSDSGSAKQTMPQDKEASPVFQEANNLLGIGKEHIQISSQGDEKSVGNRKGLSINYKRDMLRQKAFQFEKNYKGRLSKGAFKAKVAAWGSMVLDKSLRTQSGCSSLGVGVGVAIKGLHSNSSSHVEGSNSHPLSNSPSLVPAAGKGKDPKSHASSVPDAKSGSKGGGADVSDTPPKAVDYYASIPFDETLHKYVPRDEKYEAILLLVPHTQEIEKELQAWMEWANDKVMQAARRLGKDQAELKMLRQEKEEIEKFNKEKQALEESTVKRLSEMEHALSNATGQIEVANCAIRRLEEENNVLKNDMQAAQLQTLRAATNLQAAMDREQETLKKLQSWEAEKSAVQDQLTNLKHQITALNNRLEKARARKDQFKALWKQEEKEKSRAQRQIDSLRKLEEEEALMKVEADNIKRAAEKEKQKCEADIKKLHTMITELRLESDRSKIAALNMGYGSYLASLPGSQLPKLNKRLAVFQDNFSESPDVKPERECVMCMTDEISVVFIPCAHQVLCGQCSVLHEKQGMNDCPSCRTAIQKRVSVTYRAD